ncbi:hypothetical protein TNCV_971681 [Trichonephila clavipes]|nr:hypothetical protein TNCV_971681 [Trichonephila clavipes]
MRGAMPLTLPQNWGGTELNCTVTCMVLRATAGVDLDPCHDELRGPRCDYLRQMALATTLSLCSGVVLNPSI